MKDTKIKDAVLVSTITGEEKIPVSNGSGKPAAVTVNLILNKVPNPDLSDYVTETELASKGYLTEHLSLDNYALKSELPDTSNLATKDEIPTDYISGNITSIQYVSALPELPEANTLYLVV